MGQVIHLNAFTNARRAADIAAQQEATMADKDARERRAMANALGGSLGAHLIAEMVAELVKGAEPPRPVPAYCDPGNETRGPKHDATRDLSPREIATRIRQDIKAAQKRGEIEPTAKISTRLHTYSGGWSVDVSVTSLPADFPMMSEAGASWAKQFGRNTSREMPGGWRAMHSDRREELITKLEAIRSAYNRDNSDSMTDYFDTRYYGSTGIDWRIRADLETAEIEASAGTYWAQDAAR